MSLIIKLNSTTGVFTPSDIITGIITSIPPSEHGVKLQAIKLTLTGGIHLHKSRTDGSPSRSRRFSQTTFLNARWKLPFDQREQFIPLINICVDHPKTAMATPGAELTQVPDSVKSDVTVGMSSTEYQFAIPLKAFRDLELDKANDLKQLYGISVDGGNRLSLLDTYHGNKVDIMYILDAEAVYTRRPTSTGMLNKMLGSAPPTTIEVRQEAEIYLRNCQLGDHTIVPYPFVMTEEVAASVGQSNVFSVHGYINNISLSPIDAISGWLQFEQGAEHVASIEIKLNRVESVGVLPPEVTEIMRIQVVDGPTTGDAKIPIFMTQIPWMTCPTVEDSPRVSIKFELGLVVRLQTLNKKLLQKSINLNIGRSASSLPRISKTFGIFTNA